VLALERVLEENQSFTAQSGRGSPHLGPSQMSADVSGQLSQLSRTQTSEGACKLSNSILATVGPEAAIVAEADVETPIEGAATPASEAPPETCSLPPQKDELDAPDDLTRPSDSPLWALPKLKEIDDMAARDA